MTEKSKRAMLSNARDRFVTKLIVVVLIIMFSGVVGGQTGLGFDGMMMLFGAVIGLFGSYSERGTPAEDVRPNMSDEQMVIYASVREQTHESMQRPNALFSLLAIGMFLFVLGIVVGLTGMTFATVMVIIGVLALIGLVYAYRHQIFYRDALSKQPSRVDEQTDAIDKLSKSTSSDGIMQLNDEEAKDVLERGSK